MRKFVSTHDIPGLDHARVEAIRRSFEREPQIIVCKCWFNTRSGKMITEVEAKSEDVTREAFERLEVPAAESMEATGVMMRARIIPVVHT